MGAFRHKEKAALPSYAAIFYHRQALLFDMPSFHLLYAFLHSRVKKCREKPALWKFGKAKLRSANGELSYKGTRCGQKPHTSQVRQSRTCSAQGRVSYKREKNRYFTIGQTPTKITVLICIILKPRIAEKKAHYALGLAWLGLAWLGLAWLGLAWLIIVSFLLIFCQPLFPFLGKKYNTLYNTLTKDSNPFGTDRTF